MLILIMLLFFLCWSPILTFNLLASFELLGADNMGTSTTTKNLKTAFSLLSYSNRWQNRDKERVTFNSLIPAVLTLSFMDLCQRISARAFCQVFAWRRKVEMYNGEVCGEWWIKKGIFKIYLLNYMTSDNTKVWLTQIKMRSNANGTVLTLNTFFTCSMLIIYI